MANPSSTLFFPLSDEASQEVSCFVNLNSVLLSDTKRDLVEKILQEQSLNTGHQSCLKSKMPPLTVTRSLGSTDAQANLVKVALWKLTLPLRAQSSRLTHVHFSRLGELLRFSTPLPWKPILLGFTAGSRWEAKLRNQAGFYIKLSHLTRYGQECEQTIPILNSWF